MCQVTKTLPPGREIAKYYVFLMELGSYPGTPVIHWGEKCPIYRVAQLTFLKMKGQLTTGNWVCESRQS